MATVRVLLQTGSDHRPRPGRPSNVGYVIVFARPWETTPGLLDGTFVLCFFVATRESGQRTMALGPRMRRPSDRSISPANVCPALGQNQEQPESASEGVTVFEEAFHDAHHLQDANSTATEEHCEARTIYGG